MSDSKNKLTLDTRNILIILFSIGITFLPYLMPENQYITQLGMRTVALMLAFLIIIISEALPMVVTCLFFFALMPLLGLTKSVPEAFYGFTQPMVFFAFISFAIAMAITKVPLANRLLRLLLVKFGKNVNMILLALMICSAVMSSFVSNVPTCVIFTSIALSFLDLIEDEESRKSVGKAFMVGVPISSMVGGMATPAGSSINLIGLAQLEKLTGETITFIEWTSIGLPFAAAVLLFAWWIIIKVYKPVNITQKEIKSIVNSIKIPDKYMPDEIKVIIIVLCMFVLWVASSWVKEINIIIVTLVGGVLFFFPGIKVIDIKTFLKENSWDIFFLLAVMFSISNLLIENGVTDTLTKIMPEMHVNMIILIGFACLLTFIMMLILPVAPSLLPILAITFVSLATKSGASAKLLIMAATLCIGNAYLIPLDILPLMTYSKGYYKFTELPKSTGFVQGFIVIVLSLWLPLIGKILGWI